MIRKAEEIGLRVHNVTSDMSGANQGLWSSFNIKVERIKDKDGKTVQTIVHNSIVHPSDPSRKLYFTPDVPHALKNFKQSLLNNEIIKLDSLTKRYYNLPSDTAHASHLHDLIELDETNELKLAPKLHKRFVTDSHFQKMRVNNAVHVLNPQVATAIEYISNENPKDERLTTAWLIDFIHRWFETMTSRNIQYALSLRDREKYNETRQFLKQAQYIISSMKIGKKAYGNLFKLQLCFQSKQF